MKWRRWVSRVLAGVAMTGGLALIVFVGVPWLMEPPAAPRPPGIEEIVAEALDPSIPGDEDALEVERLEDVSEGNGTGPPLVAVRHNGEEMAVVFPDAAGESPEGGTATPGDDLADEPHEVAGEVPGEGLPPALSPEEIAGAIEALEAGPEEGAGEPVVAGNEPVTVPDEGADALVAQAVELVAPPPPSATREVQKFLEALGYAPGPADGIWGERTAGAWRRFVSANRKLNIFANPKLNTFQLRVYC